MNAAFIFWLCFWYLVGSIPFGLFIAKIGCGIDPRKSGSCNVGATNVARLCGLRYGLAVLFLDIFKGALPVILTRTFTDSPFALSLAGLVAIIGHVFSPFLEFKGGKAVATTIGVFLSVAPWQALGAVAACIAGIFVSGFVSVGSLTLVLVMPLILYFTHRPEYIPLSLLVMLLVTWRHSGNLKRLLKGEEKSWRKKKSQ